MWSDVSGVVVTLLGIAASANWLARGRTRRVLQIKQEAELLQLLPPSPSRMALHQMIQNAVWRHVRLSENAGLVRRMVLVGYLAGGTGAGWAVGSAGTVFRLFGLKDDWTLVLMWGGFGPMVVLGVTAVWLVRSLDGKLDAVIAQGAPINHLADES